MNDSVLFAGAIALWLASVPMPKDATDIAQTIMDASDLIDIRAQPGGPRASGSGPREAKRHEKKHSSDETQGVYPIYVPHVCDIMV